MVEVDKQRKTAVAQEKPRAKTAAREDVEGEGNSSPCGNQITWGSDQTVRVVQADSGTDI